MLTSPPDWNESGPDAVQAPGFAGADDVLPLELAAALLVGAADDDSALDPDAESPLPPEDVFFAEAVHAATDIRVTAVAMVRARGDLINRFPFLELQRVGIPAAR